MKQEKHVLMIFPHPDDEAFGVSGTIADYTKQGIPVTYMCLTLGEMGRNLGNPPFATRESLPSIRKKELKDAAAVMGIQDLRMMGLRDKTVEFEDEEKLIAMITSAINELQPSLVISFYPGYSVHPDHDATGHAVVQAIARLPKETRPTLHAVAFSHNCEEELGAPDIINDVRDNVDVKLATLKAHASQTQLLTGPWEEKLIKKDPEVMDRLYFERFWTYKFKN
ncbi:MAG: bacillithiol biosynthesis deacetylase BshB2 [Bacillus sp. (in: firmicutes)]